MTVLPSQYDRNLELVEQHKKNSKINMEEHEMPLTFEEKTFAIQSFLKLEGYPPGPIDGDMGRKTQGAMNTYKNALDAYFDKHPEFLSESLTNALYDANSMLDKYNTEQDATKKETIKKDLDVSQDKLAKHFYDHVVDRLNREPDLKKSLAKKAFALKSSFTEEDKKMVEATGLLFDPDLDITIDGRIVDGENMAWQIIQDAALSETRKKPPSEENPSNEDPYVVETPLEHRENRGLSGKSSRTLPTTGKDWYAAFGAKLGVAAQEYDNGYINVLGKTNANPSFATFTIDVLNKTIQEERQRHVDQNLTNTFNSVNFFKDRNMSNKKLIKVFDSATAFRKIDDKAQSKLVNATANQNIDVKVGDVLFLNIANPGSREERRNKNPVIVTKIDVKGEGAMESLEKLDKDQAAAIKSASNVSAADWDQEAMKHIEETHATLKIEYDKVVNTDPSKAKALEGDLNKYTNAMAELEPLVHAISNGENYALPLRYFTEGNAAKLKEIGVHGIGDTQELVKKYKAFEEGTMIGDPTLNNEELDQKLLQDAPKELFKSNMDTGGATGNDGATPQKAKTFDTPTPAKKW
jgi:hypothetical protein